MYEVHNKPDRLEVKITGTVDQKALYKIQQTLMLHPAYPYKNSLWVFDEGFVCDFSNLDMFEAVNRIKTYFPVGAKKEKGALLASTGFQYGLFKIFCEEADRERIPFKMRAFRSYRDAKAWLR
ncbi:MAG: hypothetical protein JW764_09005 [Chlorobiaceae bacterium]|nr:hypothetical protein [Chlorobiaceae bacterium]